MSMLFLVSGPPGPHALFGLQLVQALAETAFGQVKVAHVGEVEELRAAIAGPRPKALVVFAEAPDCGLVGILSRTSGRILSFEERVAELPAFLAARHGLTPVAALRHATLLASTNAPLLHLAHCERFPTPEGETRLLSVLHRLCLIHGIHPGEELVARVFEALDLGPVDPRLSLREAIFRRPAIAGKERLEDDPGGSLVACARAYDRLGEGGLEVSWPPALCLLADQPDQPVQGPIAMIGPARLLSYGPYLHLPAGEWEMELSLTVADNRSGNRLRVSVLEGGEERAAASADLPAEGRLALSLAFRVEEPRRAIEIYPRLLEGAIEGNLSIDAIRMTRVASS